MKMGQYKRTAHRENKLKMFVVGFVFLYATQFIFPVKLLAVGLQKPKLL
jgi:hypothetical protein